jgi:hypothetical protein
MSGAIPPIHQYAFMAWCSVKAQGQIYLYIYLYLFTVMVRALFKKQSVFLEMLETK